MLAKSSAPRVAKPMHPKMLQRAAQVKASHAHLATHTPGFSQLPATQRMKAVQAHVTRALKGR